MSEMVVGKEQEKKLKSFGSLVKGHLSRHWISYVLGAALLNVFGSNYRIGLNTTESLPYKICVIHLGEMPKKGEIAAIAMHNVRFYGDAVFNKYVKGVPGDVVESRDREFFINGASVGTAKKLSKKGEPLTMNTTGVIPEGRYWIATPSKDSFDSRYKDVGLISRDQIIGRVYPIL